MSQFHCVEVSPEVIRAAIAGQGPAHAQIYVAYRQVVFTLIRRLIPRNAIAEEIFQDVFVEILRSIGSYSGSGSFGGWVRSVAINKSLMYLRSPWHRRLFWIDASDPEDASLELADVAPGSEVQLPAQQELERALATLPAVTRSVVWLHDVEGYTHGEIARLLGRTTSFSKTQLSRAHRRLRELLESPDEAMSCMPVSTSC
jgi:RNA polymerase sigma factor (sigma-70 family)